MSDSSFTHAFIIAQSLERGEFKITISISILEIACVAPFKKRYDQR